MAVLFGFNEGRSRSTWQGFSLRWYYQDPNFSVLHDPSLRDALVQSLKLAGLTMLIATPLGVALAIGLARWTREGRQARELPHAVPARHARDSHGRGVVLGIRLPLRLHPARDPGAVARARHLHRLLRRDIVRGRLFAVGREYEEAAMDLGASQWQAMRMVLLPMLAPAIWASLMIAFAISIDDFVITAFLMGDQTSRHHPGQTL